MHLFCLFVAICGAPVLPFCGACRRGEVEGKRSGGEEEEGGEEEKGKWRRGEEDFKSLSFFQNFCLQILKWP